MIRLGPRKSGSSEQTPVGVWSRSLLQSHPRGDLVSAPRRSSSLTQLFIFALSRVLREARDRQGGERQTTKPKELFAFGKGLSMSKFKDPSPKIVKFSAQSVSSKVEGSSQSGERAGEQPRACGTASGRGPAVRFSNRRSEGACAQCGASTEITSTRARRTS